MPGLNQYAVAVVDFVLNGLGDTTRALNLARAQKLVLVANHDVLEPARQTHALKRQAAFLGVVRVGPVDKVRVQHR